MPPVPGKDIPYTRVNHNKYMVTDNAAYISELLNPSPALPHWQQGLNPLLDGASTVEPLFKGHLCIEVTLQCTDL